MKTTKIDENGQAIEVDMAANEAAALQAEWDAFEAGRVRMQIKSDILKLEREVTDRRLREAVCTQEGRDWLVAQNASIAELRAQL